MTDEQKTTIKGYATTLDSDITEGALLDLVVDTVADRVLLYLNETELNPQLERIVAQVVVANYQTISNPNEQTISSVSDNGQTVSYRQKAISHYGSASDSELFGGFEKLLSSYRRPHVITSQL